MDKFPTCKVGFIMKNKRIYNSYEQELNEAQIKALSLSRSVFIIDSYYDIEDLAYNQETQSFEVFLK